MHQLFYYIRLFKLDCLSKMRSCQRCNTYKSLYKLAFTSGKGDVMSSWDVGLCSAQSEM